MVPEGAVNDLAVCGVPIKGWCQVPEDVAKCPTCSGALFLDIVEWLPDEGGAPTEVGCWIECSDEDCPTVMSYQEGVELNVKVYEWAEKNVRVTDG